MDRLIPFLMIDIDNDAVAEMNMEASTLQEASYADRYCLKKHI